MCFPHSIITSMIIDANRSWPKSSTPMNACSHKSISVCERCTQSELKSVREKKKKTHTQTHTPWSSVPQSGEEVDRLEEEEGD